MTFGKNAYSNKAKNCQKMHFSDYSIFLALKHTGKNKDMHFSCYSSKMKLALKRQEKTKNIFGFKTDRKKLWY